MKHAEVITEVFKNVEAAASRFSAERPNVNPSDALSAASAGYLRAALRWTPDREAAPGSLWNFARLHVFGAMVDDVRSTMGLDRKGKQRQNQIDEITQFGYSVAYGDPWAVRALGILGAREAEIVRRRYWLEQTFREIGRAMRMHESRAFQIHGEALAKLRGYLG